MRMDEQLHSLSIPASSPNPHAGEGASLSSGPAVTKRTAVLLDGGFVYYRFAHILKRRMTATDVPSLARGLLDPCSEELFRIYFYDCAPFDGTTTHPISGKTLNLRATATYQDNTTFQRAVAQAEQISLRRGELAFRGWSLSHRVTQDLIQNGHALSPTLT